MAIVQLADTWFAAVKSYCEQNAVKYLREDQLTEACAQHSVVISHKQVSGIMPDTSYEFTTQGGYQSIIATMAHGALALCPELTVNSGANGGPHCSGTCNLRLTVLTDLHQST